MCVEKKTEERIDEEESRIETFVAQTDKLGHITVPKHIRTRLGFFNKSAEVTLQVRVNKVYEEE